MLKPLAIGAGLIVAAAAGYFAAAGKGTSYSLNVATPASTTTGTPVKPATSGTVDWIAAAPGRVEPRFGEVRISSGILGQVSEVLVKVNDPVEADELLIRLDDDESRARLAAAEAEAGARKRDRAASPVQQGREDAIKAEDAVFSAERAVTGARYELDYALGAKRKANGADSGVTDARKRLADAKDRAAKERINYATVQAKANLPTPTQVESALTAARANVAMADALLEKTRIRAADAGTVLQVNAKAGEMIAPGGEQPLAVVGDMSIVRVKAEVDDGDIAKLKVGQKAYVRSLNYPGRDFE
ncbi:MAG: HlyD family efflux transporter periplasmic adaptor subunit, partial [Hyphomicrobiaceae bacterium]